MKKLITGEQISIDNHLSNVEFKWNSDQDIHLDKKTNVKGHDTKIPLNSDI